MALFDLFKNKKVPQPEEYKGSRIYDYSTPEGRIATAEWLFDQAKMERTVKEQEWTKFDAYYHFAHDAAKEMAEAVEDSDVPFMPACVPDPFIQVESQIIPDIPQPEFHGRDDDLDSSKAKKRELAVKFVIENNRLGDMNTANERRLRKYGDAFWKAFWDDRMPCGRTRGDIRIKDISLEDIYPDPTTLDLQDGEYVDYVYTLHKLQFWRIYADTLKRQGYCLDDVLQQGYREIDSLLAPYTQASRCRDDMVQVLEHWFKQPFDAEDGSYKSGDIACSIQAGGIELKYIPRYWQETGDQCKLFPFVHYWCIRDENQLWNMGEVEPIIPMVDTADRELGTGILNDSFMANDIVLCEEGALAPGETFSNVPGSVINVKQGRLGGVARLGGLSSGVRSLNMVNWALDQIQRTNRNYDSNTGREPSRVTTASGLLQLRTDAANQQNLKTADRNAGFCRLYELIDWLCLEFYDDDRMLFIGAKKADEEPETVMYNRNDFREGEDMFDLITGEPISPEHSYYPRVDVTVTAGNALTKNPATTVEILDKLAAIQVTADNYKLVAAELEYLDIPQKNDIINSWKEKFESPVPPEIMQALAENPELLAAVTEAISPNQLTQNEVLAPAGPIDPLGML